jgi:hypothetical protein
MEIGDCFGFIGVVLDWDLLAWLWIRLITPFPEYYTNGFISV